jgi:tRNA(adenine34) deaminase
MQETIIDQDLEFMQRAVALALAAESAGNLPVGALITLEGKIIAEGASSLFVPYYDPKGHAEMNALDNVDLALWKRAAEMTCYTTLEPCCMCFGRLLLSGVGRIVFGSSDTEGGSSCLLPNLPKFYGSRNTPRMIGPLMPEICDPLFRRAFHAYTKHAG